MPQWLSIDRSIAGVFSPQCLLPPETPRRLVLLMCERSHCELCFFLPLHATSDGPSPAGMTGFKSWLAVSSGLAAHGSHGTQTHQG